MNNFKIKIVIPLYNGLVYLPDLFRTLLPALANYSQSEIVVVDDQSTDGSLAWLMTHQPQVKVITSPQKLLFARGANLGFQYALSTGADFIFLLNQDTEVSPDFLEPLIKSMLADQTIGAIQPRIMLHPETDLVNSDGSVIHYLGFGFAYGHKRPANPRIKNGQEVNYCSGAATLFRASVLKQIGFFDENLEMYHEDLDLGWRLSLFGYKNILNTQSIIYHKYEFSRSIKKLYFMERNRFWVLFKNYQLSTIFLILPLLVAVEIGLILVALLKGWSQQEFRALGFYLSIKNWQELLRQRKNIQNLRVVSDKQVVTKFAYLLDFQEMPSFMVKYIANPIMLGYWFLIKKLI